MPSIKVRSVTIHSDRLTATAKEAHDGVQYVARSGLRRPELVDTDLEGDRDGFTDESGAISICVAAGDELGALSVNLQFEGKSGMHAVNLERQGSLIEQAGDWLGAVLEELGIDYQLDVEAQPCKQTDERLPVAVMAASLVALSNETVVSTSAKSGVAMRVEPAHSITRAGPLNRPR